MTAHCLFEQSGTFRDAFRKHGIPARCYDIRNDYGKTDVQIDIFQEIRDYMSGGKTLFKGILQEDIVMAFFPCTYFSNLDQLSSRAQRHETWDEKKRLAYSVERSSKRHEYYTLLCQLVTIALDKGFPLIVENPYTQPNFLTQYFPLKPAVIDTDRRVNGDRYKKPTQFYFIGIQPRQNVFFEPLEQVDEKRVVHTSRGKRRSEITSQYADRFIRTYILERID